MESTIRDRFMHFLVEDMGISAAEVAIAQRLLERLHPQLPDQSVNLLPIVLWQYGLVNLEQLNHLLDWVETVQFLAN